MPNTKSAKKRVRQNEKRREANRAAKSAMKTAVKKAKTNTGDEAVVKTAISTISRTSKRGVVHPKKASRLISRLQKQVNKAAKSAEA